MSKLLEITDLYGGYQKDVNILQGINLTVDEGETVGIIGLNGSGKSTLGKAIMNLIPYRNGHIVFEGQSVEDKTTHELSQLGIALMHQGGVVFPNLSVWQNLQLAINSASRTAETQSIASLQSVIPLLQHPQKELMRTMADKLSGGQCHELALAMTLARRPKLVILDEPSAGLTPKAVKKMYGMLEEIRKDSSIGYVIIEQSVSTMIKNCSRILYISQGQVKYQFENNESNIFLIDKLIF